MAGDAKKHIPLYMGVFIALIIGTIVTVAVAEVDIPFPWNYVVGLAIACTKASLVAYIFMHLKWENCSWLWWTFGITAIFFLILMLLPVLTINDHPPGVETMTWSPAPDAGDAAGGGQDDH